MAQENSRVLVATNTRSPPRVMSTVRSSLVIIQLVQQKLPCIHLDAAILYKDTVYIKQYMFFSFFGLLFIFLYSFVQVSCKQIFYVPVIYWRLLIQYYISKKKYKTIYVYINAIIGVIIPAVSQYRKYICDKQKAFKLPCEARDTSSFLHRCPQPNLQIM